ncbi:zinc ABC transporter substrate-binding protein [Seohaeicola nanhaiensis]|uniref:High-affinity zinc uptake system protein ZnuA n=1 Tax=Seohaeicola nanhaiensis TaxID=1387282 RepID=A0ABV9KAG9_9RHOB
MRHFLPAVLTCLLGTTAMAEVPKVVADIAPVHALVARVMQGVGVPELLLAPGQSPHTASMRPSQARAMQEAGLVVWIGPELTPWLQKPVETLAGNARHLDLLEVDGIQIRTYRDPGAEEDHGEHDGEEHAEHDGHDSHDHADHDDHDHEDHAEGEEHHHHSGTDPHAWLDPGNAAIWLGAIAEELAAVDAEHAEAFRANAAAGAAEIADLTAGIEAQLTPVKGSQVTTFHDGFQYFEGRFGIVSVGTLTLGDASSPSPARVAALRDVLADKGIACVFTEPQFDDRLIRAAAEGSPAKIAVLDPLGAQLEPGADLYPRLLAAMADSIASCLKP